MNRREVLSALGMGVGGVALLGPGEARAQEPHHHHDKLHGDVEGLQRVRERLQRDVSPLLRESQGRPQGAQPNRRADARLSRVLLLDGRFDWPRERADCHGLLGLRQCVREMRRGVHRHDDEEMKECVQACRTCEKACREMAKVPTPERDTESEN